MTKPNVVQSTCTDCAFLRPEGLPEGQEWLCPSCVDCAQPDRYGRPNICQHTLVAGPVDPFETTYAALGIVYSLCSKHLAEVR